MKLGRRKAPSPTSEGQNRAPDTSYKTYGMVGLQVVPDPKGLLQVPDDIPEQLVYKAIPIVSYCEPAWSRANALQVVSSLTESTVAVTSITMYRRVGRAIDESSAIWESKRRPGEQWTAFAKRSRDEAKASLEQRADAEGEAIFYNLDFSTETTYRLPTDA